jgi:hypothetical protein
MAQFYEEEDSGSSRSSSRLAQLAVFVIGPMVFLYFPLRKFLRFRLWNATMFTASRFSCRCRSSSRGSLRSHCHTLVLLSVPSGARCTFVIATCFHACFSPLHFRPCTLCTLTPVDSEAISPRYCLPKRAQVHSCLTAADITPLFMLCNIVMLSCNLKPQ